jgi:hypothetical protein
VGAGDRRSIAQRRGHEDWPRIAVARCSSSSRLIGHVLIIAIRITQRYLYNAAAYHRQVNLLD